MVGLKETLKVFGSNQCVHSKNALYCKTNTAMPHNSVVIGQVLKVKIIFRNNTASIGGIQQESFQMVVLVVPLVTF